MLPADTLVHARLETGRTHQIRVHFAAIDHPVAGDPEYGTPGRHGLERQFLHASRLAFAHPGTGEQLAFTSELPDDLRAALERARRPALAANVPKCAQQGVPRDVRSLNPAIFRSAPTIPRTLHPTPAERHGTLPGHTRVPAVAAGQPNTTKR